MNKRDNRPTIEIMIDYVQRLAKEKAVKAQIRKQIAAFKEAKRNQLKIKKSEEVLKNQNIKSQKKLFLKTNSKATIKSATTIKRP